MTDRATGKEIGLGRNGAQSELIADRLEEDIVFGRLYPRQRLVEEEICARFEAKRHVVRDALAELERLGLVERVRNRGAVVRLYGANEVREINQLRELLEGEAASLIPLPLTDTALAQISHIQTDHAEAAIAGDSVRAFRRNLDFHRTLFSFCGNRALIEAIETWAQKSHAYRSILVSDKDYLSWAAEDHRRMVDAIGECDREKLIALCRGHLRPACEKYIETYRTRFGHIDQDQASSA